jgi:mannose-6-phosphate isomerase-like protein (cupin superfamily)
MAEVKSVVGGFAAFTARWHPHVLADVNDHEVRLARMQGEFPFHAHPDTDELFLVHRGSFTMEFRDRRVTLGPGDLIVVPRGVEHRPVAAEECEVVLIERAGTRNTGDRENAFTHDVLPRL